MPPSLALRFQNLLRRLATWLGALSDLACKPATEDGFRSEMPRRRGDQCRRLDRLGAPGIAVDLAMTIAPRELTLRFATKESRRFREPVCATR